MRISVVLPTLNEAGALDAALRTLPEDVEAVVADGGSTDGTPARAVGRATVVDAPRGRARQLNAGARSAAGDVLLFLHVDTRLPSQAFAEIRRSIEAGCVGGAFLGRFDASHWSFRLAYPIRDLRVRLFHEIYGDQGIFVRRDVFEAMGGFREIPIMEDYEFVKRLRRRGRLRVIPYFARTSARRYLRHGVLRQHAKNISIWLRYLWGVDPAGLARSYDRFLETS